MTRTKNRATYDLGFKKATYMNATANWSESSATARHARRWAKRIAAGEVPETPPRPQGIERNVVITQWGWGDTFTYAHDEIATDKRHPSLYPNGPIYGVDLGNDRMLALDPVKHTASANRKYADVERLQHVVVRSHV